MNASRLLEIVTHLLDEEAKERIQKRLNGVKAAVDQLVTTPSEPTHQKAVSDSLETLRSSLDRTRSSFQAAQIKLLDEIGASRFFIDDLAGEIAGWIAEGPATPAVAQEKLAALVGERTAYVTQITQLRDSLVAVGIEVAELEPGEAEIGFMLPRDLFDNHLDKLIGELRVVRRILRAFSEVATGSAESIEVRQISTSDPLFFFGLDPATITLVGVVITWALNTWKQVEEIRKVRAETASIPALKDEPIQQLFEGTINKTIAAAVEAKVEEVVSTIEGKEARKNEQRTDIKWALESILARVERGMTVEIRMLPPPQQPDENGENPPLPSQFQELNEISRQMVFPKMKGDPILQLTAADAEKGKSKDN